MTHIRLSIRTIAWAVSAIALVVLLGWGITYLRPAAPAVQTGAIETAIPTQLTSPPTPAITPSLAITLPVSTATVTSSLVSYHSDSYPLTLQFPSSWKTTGQPDNFQGPDGFFRLQADDSGLEQLSQACELAANTSQDFGDNPQIEIRTVQSQPACAVLTSLNRADRNANLLVIEMPSSMQPRFIRLYTDPAHSKQIGDSLQITQAAGAPTLTPEPVTIPQPGESLPTSEVGVRTTGFAGLTVVEYGIIPQNIDTPSHFEFNHRIPQSILDKRSQTMSARDGARLEQANLALKPFGYTLRSAQDSSSGPFYTLYKAETVLKDQISFFHPVSLNASGTDFALVVEPMNELPVLARNNSMEEWDMSQHHFTAPVFAGDHLITIDAGPNPSELVIKSDGQTIYRFFSIFMVADPVKALFAYQGHWVLEADGFLIEDGQVLNTVLGVSEIFNWNLLDGKPFYFFTKDGKVSLAYDGQVFPDSYEQVIHYRCCEPAAFNPVETDQAIWFYALKEGLWNLVEVRK